MAGKSSRLQQGHAAFQPAPQVVGLIVGLIVVPSRAIVGKPWQTLLGTDRTALAASEGIRAGAVSRCRFAEQSNHSSGVSISNRGALGCVVEHLFGCIRNVDRSVAIS